MPPDYDEIRERIAAARTDHPDEDDTTEPTTESLDEINRRMFRGGDLPDTAIRMFRY